MKNLLLFVFFFLHFGWIYGQENFSFVFLPDSHLRPDSAIEARFDHVVDQVNKINPDFVLTGGDMIYTAKDVDNFKADTLFNYMDYSFSKFNSPVKYTFGNQELVGVLAKSGLDPSHPMWGKNMYRERYGQTYYSFDYKGWKFIVLDGIIINLESRNYSSGLDSAQFIWLKNELDLTDFNIPICIVIHTPLINPRGILSKGAYPVISEDSKEILELLNMHNLRLVLQGHNHAYMNLELGGVLYYSGGSTSNSRPIKYFNDGFTLFELSDTEIKTKFFHTESSINKPFTRSTHYIKSDYHQY